MVDIVVKEEDKTRYFVTGDGVKKKILAPHGRVYFDPLVMGVIMMYVREINRFHGRAFAVHCLVRRIGRSHPLQSIVKAFTTTADYRNPNRFPMWGLQPIEVGNIFGISEVDISPLKLPSIIRIGRGMGINNSCMMCKLIKVNDNDGGLRKQCYCDLLSRRRDTTFASIGHHVYGVNRVARNEEALMTLFADTRTQEEVETRGRSKFVKICEAINRHRTKDEFVDIEEAQRNECITLGIKWDPLNYRDEFMIERKKQSEFLLQLGEDPVSQINDSVRGTAIGILEGFMVSPDIVDDPLFTPQLDNENYMKANGV